jgi:hypothetical protein
VEAKRSQQTGTPTSPEVPELRPSDGIHKISAELPSSSYNEDSRHTKRPFGLSEPQHSPNRATPSYYIIELGLCTGISEVDARVLQLWVWGLYIGAKGWFHHFKIGGDHHVVVRPCNVEIPPLLPRIPLCLLLENILAKFGPKLGYVMVGRPAIEPYGAGLQLVGPTWFVKARGGTTFGP